MGYMEITVLVEGAAEEPQIFADGQEEEMVNSLDATKQFARDNSDMQVDIYGLHHAHEQSEDECMCVQYLTDHKPMWSSK
jgi:hypothetical protein